MNTLTKTGQTEWRHEFTRQVTVREEHRIEATAAGLEVHSGADGPPALIPWFRIDQARELVCPRVAEVEVVYGIPNQRHVVKVAAANPAAAESQARGAKVEASGTVRARFLGWIGWAT